MLVGITWTGLVCARPWGGRKLVSSGYQTLLAFGAGSCYYFIRAKDDDPDAEALVISFWLCVLAPAIAKFGRSLRNPKLFLTVLAMPFASVVVHLASSGWDSGQIVQLIRTWSPAAMPAWVAVAHLCQRSCEDWGQYDTPSRHANRTAIDRASANEDGHSDCDYRLWHSRLRRRRTVNGGVPDLERNVRADHLNPDHLSNAARAAYPEPGEPDQDIFRLASDSDSARTGA